MTSAVLVDIDGTLADNRHRLHHITAKQKNWKAFFDAMGDDPPHQCVIDLIRRLHSAYEIILVSGRPESHEQLTLDWLAVHTVPYNWLYMRKIGDYRSDTTIKKEFLDLIRQRGYELHFAIDDRPDVVRMWRENGVPCFAFDDRPWFVATQPSKDPVEWLRWMQEQYADPMFKECEEEIISLRQQVGWTTK